MKKFLIKTSLFFLPFIFLFILNTSFYNQEEGDLIRLGYLYSNPTPKSIIKSQYDITKNYTLLSEIDLKDFNKFDVITIGDSFSEQDSSGYKSFMGKKGLKVLHIDRFIAGSNPIQTLVTLFNSNLFNHVSADYIVLQSVERDFNNRNNEIDFDRTITIDSISNKINQHVRQIPKFDLQFFSDATLKIPITNILYFFQPKPKFSKTYKYPSTSNDLFSNEPNELLFYQDDINNLEIKNDSLNIIHSIEVIGALDEKAANRSMKLIMLVSPDKYDLYFNYIENNESLTKPIFFQLYDQTKKNYTNVDSYKILSEKIESEKDVYYYDDSHWSPQGAKIIADDIYKTINR